MSWPLEASYDLLVDRGDGAGLLRVQVKTCTTRQHGNGICWITRSRYAAVPGGKQRTAYHASEIDVVAVVAGDLSSYLIPYELIPYEVILGTSAITLRAFDRNRIAQVRPCAG